jgi:hypothetical protein
MLSPLPLQRPALQTTKHKPHDHLSVFKSLILSRTMSIRRALKKPAGTGACLGKLDDPNATFPGDDQQGWRSFMVALWTCS